MRRPGPAGVGSLIGFLAGFIGALEYKSMSAPIAGNVDAVWFAVKLGALGAVLGAGIVLYNLYRNTK